MHQTVFENSNELANWLAKEVGEQLELAIEKRGRAFLAVSGGSTPVNFLRRLSKLDLDWAKVWVSLVDERMVPLESRRSNQRMVTIELLQSKAAKAHLLPLYSDNAPDEAAHLASSIIDPYLPADVLILGMGTDGHTASLFPGADRLSEAVDFNSEQSIMAINAPGADETRLTMTLDTIRSARSLYLHIEGDKKRAVFEDAMKDGDCTTMPIRFVLKHCNDLRVVWTP